MIVTIIASGVGDAVGALGGALVLGVIVMLVILAVLWLILPFILISKLNGIRRAVEDFHQMLYIVTTKNTNPPTINVTAYPPKSDLT